MVSNGTTFSGMQTTRVVIDTDPGIDDVAAISNGPRQ